MEIRPIRIEGDVAYVPLTKGYEALIDASDVHLVDGFNWHASVQPNAVYAVRKTNGRQLGIHRALMDAPESMEVDHRNGNGLDNRRSNLRLATKSQNQQNRRVSKKSANGFKGVNWSNAAQKWQARIKLHQKTHYLGLYTTPEAAHAAYVAASFSLYGEFARPL